MLDLDRLVHLLIVFLYLTVLNDQKCWPYSHPDGLVGTPGGGREEEEEQYFDSSSGSSRGNQPICDTTMMFDIQ